MSLMADHFVDVGTLTPRQRTGENDLGEPLFVDLPGRAIRGLLVLKTHRRWSEMGLVEGADAAFLTEDPCADVAPPNLFAVGGRTYRDVTVSRRQGLMGDSVTRLALAGEAR